MSVSPGLVELNVILCLLPDVERVGSRLALHVHLQGLLRSVDAQQPCGAQADGVCRVCALPRVHPHLHLPLLLPRHAAHVRRNWWWVQLTQRNADFIVNNLWPGTRVIDQNWEHFKNRTDESWDNTFLILLCSIVFNTSKQVPLTDRKK